MKIILVLLCFCCFIWGNSQDLKNIELLQTLCSSVAKNAASGCFMLGMGYAEGQIQYNEKIITLDINPNKAFSYFKRSCELGNAEGCALLGTTYNEGFGTEQNFSKATEAFLKGCKQNSRLACNHLAFNYYYGKGTPTNIQKAIQLLQEGCNQKSSHSCLALGNIYYTGEGITQDLSLAKDFFQKACVYGYEKACPAYRNIQKQIEH
ncbi:hypothetical protein CCZ01_04535 [Helicobacter monodelphidis]|uniref:tetratricopeptide repeat protein n=1 Tax=Helicobacter sp. 15-1451 TaxID=2004995 RepID=UPI000DCDC438|nr:tetratricopeptide repeat protein [Helicobacter sp. 15-1451]RAX57901.1 hypothetical protein CCZ01_04535 [Helicobacter sp. 15-1451]